MPIKLTWYEVPQIHQTLRDLVHLVLCDDVVVSGSSNPLLISSPQFRWIKPPETGGQRIPGQRILGPYPPPPSPLSFQHTAYGKILDSFS